MANWDDQGTSLVVQWLRLRASSAGGLGSFPNQGTRPHMPQLKILHATTKTQSSQINNFLKNDNMKFKLLWMMSHDENQALNNGL